MMDPFSALKLELEIIANELEVNYCATCILVTGISKLQKN